MKIKMLETVEGSWPVVGEDADGVPQTTTLHYKLAAGEERKTSPQLPVGLASRLIKLGKAQGVD